MIRHVVPFLLPGAALAVWVAAAFSVSVTVGLVVAGFGFAALQFLIERSSGAAGPE